MPIEARATRYGYEVPTEYGWAKFLMTPFQTAQVSAYERALDLFRQQYAGVQTALKGTFGGGGAIPAEYGEIAELYSPTGAFGESRRAEIERTRTEDIASAYGRLAGAGMWSGTTMTGAQMGAGREAQRSLTELEDIRYGKYAGALKDVAGARELQQARMMQAYLSIAQLLGGMRIPTLS